MLDAKPITAWAVVSLVCSVLGWVGALSLLALGQWYADIANTSAGVGIILGAGHALVSAVLCLLGMICGFVALLRIHRGRFGGRRAALAGIFLACLPLALANVFWCIAGGDSSPFR